MRISLPGTHSFRAGFALFSLYRKVGPISWNRLQTSVSDYRFPLSLLLTAIYGIVSTEDIRELRRRSAVTSGDKQHGIFNMPALNPITISEKVKRQRRN